MAQASNNGQASSSTAIYTSPTNQVTIIGSVTLKNAYAGANTVEVHLANDGGAEASTNMIEVIELEEDEARSVGQLFGKQIAQGGKLYIDPTQAVNWFFSGRTVTQSADAESVG